MIKQLKNNKTKYKCICSKCGKIEIIQAINPILTDNCLDCMLKDLEEERERLIKEKKK